MLSYTGERTDTNADRILTQGDGQGPGRSPDRCQGGLPTGCIAREGLPGALTVYQVLPARTLAGIRNGSPELSEPGHQD